MCLGPLIDGVQTETAGVGELSAQRGTETLLGNMTALALLRFGSVVPEKFRQRQSGLKLDSVYACAFLSRNAFHMYYSPMMTICYPG
ncbi:hypothetical protein ABO04_04545 [Nitrosomonas sp. HPC101]|uniref:hypothetical protein n=1 Tax=Nitrosomonas sp. HPC101 TaxID=1658667 RepID=UPI001F04A856|nr:hypothetical protein [Nitrosomonas sp. HPC101]MXS85202.1 hypothetical protein [Nitrosomonas sp. HPC101]